MVLNNLFFNIDSCNLNYSKDTASFSLMIHNQLENLRKISLRCRLAFYPLLKNTIHMSTKIKPKGLLFTGILIGAVLLMSFTITRGRVTVYLAGDSTMAIKQPKAFPETGWGMPFSLLFDSTVTVDNRAQNGRSTKTFISEGLWDGIVSSLHEGDYVFIQFGHNDEVPTKKSYINEQGYRDNLERFIRETRDKKAIPVLLTPVARRKFDTTGTVVGTHEVYSAIVRKLADEQKVPLIDLDRESQALLQKLGPEESKKLFNYLAPGESINYPNGLADNTHFSELGAQKIAGIVLKGIRLLKLELAWHIVLSNLKPVDEK
jgi:lysophospholipase L1-like esterase